MNRDELADFLRKRRAVLTTSDVGLAAGSRRRTSGLRREEVAALADMSTDYYTRLEQARGPQPSLQILTSLARALRLSSDERDHLFRLAGHNAPLRAVATDHVSPGMLRILDRLTDTPAQVMSMLGETLVQTPVAVALLGDQTHFTGKQRCIAYRWFTDPSSRWMYPTEDHPLHARVFASQLREATTVPELADRATGMADDLAATNPEFAALWELHEVGIGYESDAKRVQHPEVGVMSLNCQVLRDTSNGQRLLVYTAEPGSEDFERLRLISVIGTQSMAP